MSSKRKLEEREEARAKRPRRRLRSNSEPQPIDANQAEKRVALRRLFGRILSVEARREEREEAAEAAEEVDEGEDPLLDGVPVDLEAEALGFLVCAQETLRFLHTRGLSMQHPMFARLRSRLLQGISDIGLA
ncbi:uncharacterized protein LOC105383236 [Plutella xylostella]|uniref:uncharacterized protein LOC105383236 n=1 Tax=Plutella xylostella TaxID=51655 RepID=UPI002032851F|nr:uncharacterized protein LOC105383236 [Plutella xylostella]